MADVTFTAACPACGSDATWRGISPSIGTPFNAPSLEIEVRCDSCDQQERADRG